MNKPDETFEAWKLSVDWELNAGGRPTPEWVRMALEAALKTEISEMKHDLEELKFVIEAHPDYDSIDV